MSNLDSDQPGSPASLSLRKDPQVRALTRKLFLIAMTTAALPVVIALGIMSDVQPDTSSDLAPANSTPVQKASPQIAATHAPSDTVDATVKTDPSRGAAEPDGQDAPSAVATAPDQRGDEQTPEIRFVGLEPETGSTTTAAHPFANAGATAVRLETPPPPEDALQRHLLRNAPLPSILKPFWSENPETDEDAPDARNTAAANNQAKRVHTEIKSHAIAHHRRHSPKHPPATLFAKIGRSVKGAWMNAVTFARGGRERGLWE